MRWRIGKRRAQNDLGIGSVIADTGRGRVLERDGSFHIRRRGLGIRAVLSLYHTLLTVSWPVFLGLLAGGFLLANAVFALAYVACGPGAISGGSLESVGGEFGRAFFFSVHTLSTVGYGNLTPANLGANILVSLEILVGLVGIAIATGLVFARFSRPTADILWSHEAVVAPYRGGAGLMFRVANRRRNQILGLRATVLLTFVTERDGERKREFEQLALERDRIELFPWSWTVVHPIDEDSPLHGMSHEDLVAGDCELIVILEGVDETFSQTVYARSSYKHTEIVWGARFVDVFERDSEGRPSAMDLSRLHTHAPAEVNAAGYDSDLDET